MSLPDSKTGQFSRRRLFGAVGTGAALVGVGAIAGHATASGAEVPTSDVVEFRGDLVCEKRSYVMNR